MDRKTTDVLVVIPTLNEENNIEHCLKSIRAQKTARKLKVVVCDGLSEDKTTDIATKYAEKIVHSKQRGISTQRNKGAHSLKSRLILFVDADTILPENYIEKGAAKFDENPELIAFSASFRFPERRKRILFAEKVTNEYLKFRDKMGSATLPGFNIFVKRDAFEHVGGFREIPLEDIDLSRRLNEIGVIHYYSDLHVVTSSRRLEKMGLLGALRYYFEMDLSRERPEFKKLLVYSDYVPCRPTASRIQEAFRTLYAMPRPMTQKLSPRKYLKEKTSEAIGRIKEELNETTDWAKEKRREFFEETATVSKSLSYLQSKTIDSRIIDLSLEYVKKIRKYRKH